MRRRTQPYSVEETPELVRLWIFRLLIGLGAHKNFVQRGGLSDDALAATTGIGHWTDDNTERFVAADALAELRRNARAAEAERRSAVVPLRVARNVKRLATLVGLNAVEARILTFTVLLHGYRTLRETADLLGGLSFGSLTGAMAALLRLPEPRVRAALGGDGILARAGLLTVDYKNSRDASSKIDLLSESFAELMIHSDADPASLLRASVTTAAAPDMVMSDYEHIAPTLSLLIQYLRKAIAARRRGVNVLIYGLPGTGKTQLARVLASELQLELFEVASEDMSGDTVPNHARLRAYRAAQSFFARRKAMIAFDEIEDVFAGEVSFWGTRTPARNKAWVNRALEGNPIPAIWMSNSVDCLDPAVIRRFDQVIELPIPPMKKRAELIQKSCAGLLNSEHVTHLARCEHLAPAIVIRAAAVVGLVKNELDPTAAAAALSDLINNTLRAQGHASTGALPSADSAGFSLEFLQADSDLQGVAQGLARTRSGRLCFYGPPGTGKTAFAHYIADQLGLPLHAKRASDLLSKWVGDSEKNVARTFESARRDGGVLVFDEADTFLVDRRGARNSWEVSLTNELLTQLEAFDGIFIASTNLIEGLDPAALRRFDLKAQFDFLNTDQVWGLLKRQLAHLQLPAPSDDLQSRLGSLDALTPGDFAALARRHRFQPLSRAEDWLAALEAEAMLKRGGKKRIGFQRN